ncbi:hypothetical protein L1887_43432 [Cichorium endivia]|nr:hypothetical protein L1887_43432 [Cichorium endivia]
MMARSAGLRCLEFWHGDGDGDGDYVGWGCGVVEARRWDGGRSRAMGEQGENVRMRVTEGGANVVLYHSGVWDPASFCTALEGSAGGAYQPRGEAERDRKQPKEARMASDVAHLRQDLRRCWSDKQNCSTVGVPRAAKRPRGGQSLRHKPTGARGGGGGGGGVVRRQDADGSLVHCEPGPESDEVQPWSRGHGQKKRQLHVGQDSGRSPERGRNPGVGEIWVGGGSPWVADGKKMQLQRSHAQALQSPGSRFGARAVGRNDRQTRPAWTGSRTQDEASLAGTRARWGSHGGVLHCCSSCLPSEATLEWRLISATRRQRPWIDNGDPKGAGVWGAKGLLRAFDAALDPLHRRLSSARSSDPNSPHTRAIRRVVPNGAVSFEISQGGSEGEGGRSGLD